MEKRFQAVQDGVIVSAIIVLTPTEQRKLECKDLEGAINEIADKLNVKWAVEISGNIATATISRQYGPVVGDAQTHELEMKANVFMRAIEHLSLPPRKVQNVDDAKNTDDAQEESASSVVIKFNTNGNNAPVIKALRECTSAKLEVIKRYTKNGRLVCSDHEATKLMENLAVVGATDIHIDKKLSDDLNFCNAILADWDATDEMAQTTGAVILCGTRHSCLQVPCAKIGEELLKKMFIVYVESI